MENTVKLLKKNQTFTCSYMHRKQIGTVKI